MYSTVARRNWRVATRRQALTRLVAPHSVMLAWSLPRGRPPLALMLPIKDVKARAAPAIDNSRFFSAGALHATHYRATRAGVTGIPRGTCYAPS